MRGKHDQKKILFICFHPPWEEGGIHMETIQTLIRFLTEIIEVLSAPSVRWLIVPIVLGIIAGKLSR